MKLLSVLTMGNLPLKMENVQLNYQISSTNTNRRLFLILVCNATGLKFVGFKYNSKYCFSSTRITLYLPGETKVLFTYEVNWVRSDVRWASRWDTYLAMSDVQIHWFSIVNSVVVIFFLAGKFDFFCCSCDRVLSLPILTN